MLWLPAMLATGRRVPGGRLQESLPPLMTPAGLAALRANPVAPLMPGAAPLLIVVEALLALAYLVAAALSYGSSSATAAGPMACWRSA